MRLGYQPLDGDHAGSSQFTEFLLLLKASDDAEPRLLGMDEFLRESMGAGTTHPAVFVFPNLKPAAEQVVTRGTITSLLIRRRRCRLGPAKTGSVGLG